MLKQARTFSTLAGSWAQAGMLQRLAHNRGSVACRYNDFNGMIAVVQLGLVDYATGLRLQAKLVELRKAGQIGDVLLLLEHGPVITLGRNAKAANILLSPEELGRRGVEMFECDRGGDVTFHGPGQLVGYPIFDLRGFHVHGRESAGRGSADSGSGQRPRNAMDEAFTGRRKTLGAVDYVRRLEEVLIRSCADFGIATRRVAGLTGVWTEGSSEGRGAGMDGRGGGPAEEAKVAAIGVHISRSVTSHGFALNVNSDLSYFDLIVPCGIATKPVTSMKRELGQDVDMNRVAQSVSRHFGGVFGREMLWVDTLDALLGNTVGVPVKVPDELRRMHGDEDLFPA